jgi:hypothetical protein
MFSIRLFLISFLYLHLLCFWFRPSKANSIIMTLNYSTKGKWIFEENVMLWPIHYHQTSMCSRLTLLPNMFLVKDDMLCYYNGPPTIDGCFWMMSKGYFNFIFEHLSTLGEVLWLHWKWFFSDSFTLIPKGHFCSYSKWNDPEKHNFIFFEKWHKKEKNSNTIMILDVQR